MSNRLPKKNGAKDLIKEGKCSALFMDLSKEVNPFIQDLLAKRMDLITALSI